MRRRCQPVMSVVRRCPEDKVFVEMFEPEQALEAYLVRHPIFC